MKKRIFSYLAVLLLALTMLAGCNSQPAGTGGGAETGKKQSIGMVVKDVTAEYIQAFVIGAQNYCDEHDIELKVIDGGYDTIKFLDAINQYIMQGIDGFIIAAVEDPIAIIPGIESLNEKGIPVFALDTCPEGGVVDMFITFDIEDSSRRAAEQMIEGIKAANGGQVPEGVIIEITGALVDMFAQECISGSHQVFYQYPQLTVVQGEGKWFNEDAYARTSDLLTRHGSDVIGIYCHTPDIMGSGVVSAVENAGLAPKDYFISGICIGSEGIELLKSGKLYAVVEQPALDSATFAVQYLDDLYNGRPIPQAGETLTQEGALWSPAHIIENEFADGGATMILQGPLIPQESPPSDERLWGNILFGN